MLTGLEDKDNNLSVALFKREFPLLVFCWDWSQIGRVSLQLALQLRNTLDWMLLFLPRENWITHTHHRTQFCEVWARTPGSGACQDSTYLATCPSREESPKQVKPEQGQGPCCPNAVCMLQIMLETLAGWVLQLYETQREGFLQLSDSVIPNSSSPCGHFSSMLL